MIAKEKQLEFEAMQRLWTDLKASERDVEELANMMEEFRHMLPDYFRDRVYHHLICISGLTCVPKENFHDTSIRRRWIYNRYREPGSPMFDVTAKLYEFSRLLVGESLPESETNFKPQLQLVTKDHSQD